MRWPGWVWAIGAAITLAAAAACHRVVDLTPADARQSSGDAALGPPDAGFDGLGGLGDGAFADAVPDAL